MESITKAPAASSVSLFGTLHVVVAIAREPVDLVHDDEVGALLSHEAHQLLQAWPIGRAGGLAGVEELGEDAGAELAGLAAAGLALGRDGEALAGLPKITGT